LPKPDFWKNSKRYYDLKSFWRNQFGSNVYKLPIDAGFTCPNRDGTVASGGCIYCDGRGSQLRRSGPLPSVGEQISRGQEYYRRHRKAGKFIAYFQTFTNTHAPVDRLKRLYNEALSQEDVIGLSIGTRPDCVPDDTLDMIQAYASRYHVWLEFGLQSIHDRTLKSLNRGHNTAQFLDAVKRAEGKNILICAHIILGLPGETHADMIETAKILAGLPVQGIKIHLLLALQGTPLGEQYRQGKVRMLAKEEYTNTVCDILEILPPQMVIQRLTADGYRDIFLAPDWAVNKMDVLNSLDREMTKRDSWQGKLYNMKTNSHSEV
jgi:uncharacterized protein